MSILFFQKNFDLSGAPGVTTYSSSRSFLQGGLSTTPVRPGLQPLQLGSLASLEFGVHPNLLSSAWKKKGLPSRELTYPTLEKGKSSESSKCNFWGIC